MSFELLVIFLSNQRWNYDKYQYIIENRADKVIAQYIIMGKSAAMARHGAAGFLRTLELSGMGSIPVFACIWVLTKYFSIK